MHLSSFDVCTSGFERLRNQDEFILATPIDATYSADDIRTALHADLQCCDRGDDFDWDAASALIDGFCADLLPLGDNPFGLEPNEDDDDDSLIWEGCYLFLYVSN